MTISFSDHKLSLSIFLLWLFAVSGSLGLIFGYDHWFLPKTPINLLVLCALLVLNYPIRETPSIIIFLLAFVTGMVVEIIGVKTGVIFGAYYYGSNLGPKILEVPYLIGINWVILTFTCAAIAVKFAKNTWRSVLIASILMVAFDLILEMVAGKMDYWHWTEDAIPLKNYIAWFLVSLFLQWATHRWVGVGNFRFSINLFFSQLLFLVVSLFTL